jgi:hypothetical protein
MVADSHVVPASSLDVKPAVTARPLSTEPDVENVQNLPTIEILRMLF